MGAFVRWFAGRYEEVRAAFDRKVSEYRAIALSSTAHARTPEIVANLQAGFELYLEFGAASGAVDAAERDRLASLCWEALSVAATAQARRRAATEPAARFLALLRSVLTSGRAHLASRNGDEPHRPGPCGWRRDNAGTSASFGDCIGWVEGDNVYLEPTATYRAVQLVGRDAGEVLTVTEHTLRRRLRDKGLLDSVDEAREFLTRQLNIDGSSKSVLHFRRSTILPEVSDGDEDAE